jgi:thermitase
MPLPWYLRGRSRSLRPLAIGVAAVLLVSFLLASGGSSAPGGQALLLVKFAPGQDRHATDAALSAVGATDLGENADIGVQMVSVPSEGAGNALGRLKKTPGVEFAEPDATVEAADVPNDPSYPSQWALAKIDAPDAWTTDHGSSSVVVAVVDTGVSLSHPDLASKIVGSVNFSSSATADDVNGHGSHVAGIIAAATNNGVGVAGLGWNTDLLDVKALDDSGSGLYSNVINGITWAADHGADVINLSLGGTMDSPALESAVDYAWSKGAVVVAAAGNSASSAPFYPAYYPNAIAVAATTDLDKLASFSDYGDWVDVAAPGISIYSTVPGGYQYMSGTSMAAPYVSGLAALLFAEGLTNDQVRSRIQSTADNIGVAGIGSGRINAYRAVTQTSSPSAPTNATAPAITGSAVVANTLQASTGTWTGSPTSYAYQWQRCDTTGANCAPISGATLSSYLLSSTDAGSTIRAQVTASNTAGFATSTSAQTAAVTTASPSVSSLPTLSGTAQDGQVLQTSTGTWTGSPTGYAYQWLRCDSTGNNCGSISGATSASYSVTSVDVGSTISSQVTATNAGGSASAQSAQSAVVAAAPPVNTALPAESGKPSQGQVLTTSNGSWKGTTPMSDGYQWLRCSSTGASCAAISGATGPSYTLGPGDVGSTVRSQVTAANAAGQASATSAQTAVVTNVQTLAFNGTFLKNVSLLSFQLSIGAGEADATLTFPKSTSLTVQLMNSAGTVVGQVSGKSSPLKLNIAGLSAGSYKYVVSGSGIKGSVAFALAVTAPGP